MIGQSRAFCATKQNARRRRMDFARQRSSDRVLAVADLRGGGDTTAAMGILSNGFRAKLFCRCGRVWGVDFVCSPRTPAAASGAGFWGRRAPNQVWLGLFLWRVSSSSSAESSPRAICYPQAHPQRIGACIMTYSGREEERAPSIYRSSSWSRSAAVSRVRRSKGFSSVGEKVSLLSKFLLSRAFFS